MDYSGYEFTSQSFLSRKCTEHVPENVHLQKLVCANYQLKRNVTVISLRYSNVNHLLFNFSKLTNLSFVLSNEQLAESSASAVEGPRVKSLGP